VAAATLGGAFEGLWPATRERTIAARDQVEFADHVRASLSSLHERWTYIGLLDGSPTPDLNRRIVNRERERYRAAEHQPLLIEPFQTPDSCYSRERALLPQVFCVGDFQADCYVSDDLSWRSELTLLWWQDDWALPIDTSVLAKVRQFAWRDFAYDTGFD
jgi:hypothetical protein